MHLRHLSGLVLTALLAVACTPTLVNFPPRVHVVQSGETLFSIAWRYQLDVRELVVWNDLDNPDLILVGQRLFLTPDGMAESLTAAAGRTSAGPSASPGQTAPSRPAGAPAGSGSGGPATAAPGQQASTSAAIPLPAPPVAIPVPAPSSRPAPSPTPAPSSIPVPAPAPAAGSMGAAPASSGQAAAPQPPPQPPPRPPAQTPSRAVLPAAAWQWPVRGAVVSPYGAAQGTGSGIGIGGQLGADIRASAAGQVVYAGDGLAAYGNLIIIKHNDMFLSAYGHNDTLVVGEGDAVEQGDVIARMGMGPERQPQVHFEIRRNGTPVDPLGYLPD